METILLAILRAYKRYLSPTLPTACRYVPTCSEYAMEAIERNGVLRGSAQAFRRFVRCNPLGGHGYDPVKGNDCKCHERPRPREAWMGRHEFQVARGASVNSRRNGEA